MEIKIEENLENITINKNILNSNLNKKLYLDKVIENFFVKQDKQEAAEFIAKQDTKVIQQYKDSKVINIIIHKEIEKLNTKKEYSGILSKIAEVFNLNSSLVKYSLISTAIFLT